MSDHSDLAYMHFKKMLLKIHKFQCLQKQNVIKKHPQENIVLDLKNVWTE